MSRNVPIGDAKARFAECVREAEAGSTIVLTRHGRPVARICPLGPGAGLAVPGGAGGVAEPIAPYDEPVTRQTRSRSRREALERLLREEIWARVPAEQLGKGITKRERERILGLEGEPE